MSIIYSSDEECGGCKWRNWIRFGFWDWKISVSLEQQLIVWGGEPRISPTTVKTYMSVALRLNPLEWWRFGSYHTYYDGCHHGIDLGPIVTYSTPDNCDKCYPGEE